MAFMRSPVRSRSGPPTFARDHRRRLPTVGPPTFLPSKPIQSGTNTCGRRRIGVQSTEDRMAKVTGIGGVFFKSTNDHKKLAEWYSQNLGIQLEPWGGAILNWTEDKSEDRGLTVWHVAEKKTGWVSPSPRGIMLNYRLDHLPELLAQVQR